jgi:hypothetical protein
MSVPDVGLCATCRFVRLVPSVRNVTYYRCGRSDDDESYRRFPRLPVVSCAGYERRAIEASANIPPEDAAPSEPATTTDPEGGPNVKR